MMDLLKIGPAAVVETPLAGLGTSFCKFTPIRRAGKPGSTAGRDARRHGGLSELIRPNPSKKIKNYSGKASWHCKVQWQTGGKPKGGEVSQNPT
jgi:hypothetical protein